MTGAALAPDSLCPYRVFLVALTLAVAFSFQGSRGLYDSTEGRYAEVAREMAERGAYLEPTLNYRPHWAKPPLTYWAIAAGMGLLGQNEWGVRLFNAVAFCLTVALASLLAKRLWGSTAGLIAGLVYASSPFSVLAANFVSTDTILTLFETAAVFCYASARGSARPRAWIAAMWCAFGFGFLTKGPPALLPLIPIAVWHLRARPGARLLDPFGLLLFAGVGLSWFAAVCTRNEGLLAHFIGGEVVRHIASDTVHDRQWYKPVAEYLLLLTIGAGPWLYFGVRLFIEKRLWSIEGIRSALGLRDSSLFLVLWLLVPLAVFSAVRSRLPLYVLPIYAPIALAIACGIARRRADSPAAIVRPVAAIAAAAACLLIGFKGALAWYPDPDNMKQLYELVLSARSGPAVVTVINKAKLYGLQFYLNGRLRRWSSPGKEAWADDIALQAVRELGERGTVLPHVFVCEDHEMRWLCGELRNAGFDPKRLDPRLTGPRWAVSSIDPKQSPQ